MFFFLNLSIDYVFGVLKELVYLLVYIDYLLCVKKGLLYVLGV